LGVRSFPYYWLKNHFIFTINQNDSDRLKTIKYKKNNEKYPKSPDSTSWKLILVEMTDTIFRLGFQINKFFNLVQDTNMSIVKQVWSVDDFQVIQALVSLINEPEPDHPLRGDLVLMSWNFFFVPDGGAY